MADQRRKVLIADSISEEGINVLRSEARVDLKVGLKPAEIAAIIGDYDALVVRSQTRVTAEIIEAGKKLQVIARAGVGIDNIDVDAATRYGIVVINAPTGNTVSAAEHAIALMLTLSRNIPQANAALKSGQWRRNEFMGTELRGKTLGIVGLGNVGSEVAKRAQGFEMKLLGNDPLVSMDYARKLQVELVDLKQLLRESDFITLHLPLTAQTRKMFGPRELEMLKPTARIINCARGGLIDDESLVKAIREKKLAGAAIDVFENEPITDSILFGVDNIIVTPHLGASTTEAQVLAARDVAEQIVDVFRGLPARSAINVPYIPSETLQALAPFVRLAGTLCKIVFRLAEGQGKSIRIKYEGDIANFDTNVLKAAVIGGLLEGICEERVNLVNCNLIAARRGLTVVEEKDAICENYASLLTVEMTTSSGTYAVAGTVMHDESHIVRVNDYWLDIVPTPGSYFLFSDHLDRPGFIGAIGKITGDADINISSMHLGRLKRRGQALLVLTLDEPIPEAIQQQILAIPDVYSVKLVGL
ncbi:MAG TPA: phosphoglycerate dehydrogenase [Dehalococcoidales bacterium]|nr:MAG: phosphoglycerate dehydrogenase [Chloroflexi bacterium RBG_16_60_22]HJX12278.1 phosphoglycerate dehydrogenase [Dehalococcoidales bacterium]